MTLKNGSRRRRRRRRRILDNFQSTVFHPIELKAQIIHPSYSQQIDTKRQLSSSIFVIFLLKHRLAWKLEANREVLQWIAKDECRKDEDPLSAKRCAFVVKVLETARWTKRQRFNETDVGKEREIGRERKRESGRGGKICSGISCTIRLNLQLRVTSSVKHATRPIQIYTADSWPRIAVSLLCMPLNHGKVAGEA